MEDAIGQVWNQQAEGFVSVDARRESFTRFVSDVQPRLRRALTARCGGERGREATAEALAWAWEHWDRVEHLDNPVGYLYRMAQRRAFRRPHLTVVPETAPQREPWFEPELAHSLAKLTDRQRTAVLLIHGYAWSHREVAELMDVSIPTVQKHAERGLAKLQRSLGVTADA